MRFLCVLLLCCALSATVPAAGQDALAERQAAYLKSYLALPLKQGPNPTTWVDSERGCGWNYDPDTFRCGYRTAFPPTGRSVHIGFRVVMAP